ncbi:TRAP transporter large permease [Advenella mimigardefordensis]|uniref:TRAP transporter large permease protein n=1 Tax=Advenella mimigardefordensis (strain DSM 17166 / LMG 22922 / DPN7) TaxID=1247726 RepID=W0PD24_ADVMD|nr:TRAP transporter large permease subunit [Advenella mimigardefordensis]AHG62933.1 TRAP transporter, DctM subunit [Advenella mimigardefordensis DPN7]
MSANIILVIMFAGLTLFMLTGLPIAFVLGGLSLLITVTLWDPNAVVIMVLQIFDTMHSEALLGIPLYIFMAAILQRTGVIEELYGVMEIWFGRLRGGLAIGTVLICVLMAAMTGVVGAAVTAMGLLAMPEMLKRGYDPKLVTGTICASGTLGILIPPSILTIVYAVTAQVSIGKMLIAGIVPGLILAFIYILYILYIAYAHPDRIPQSQRKRVPFAAKLRSIKGIIFPVILVILILGSIFFGIATPTEAAAVGVAGAFIIGLLKRKLDFSGIRHATFETAKATTMILWITIGAKAYVSVFTGLGGADTLLNLIRDMQVHPYVILAAMMLILIFLGTVLDEIGIILLTVPVFLPIVKLLGFDEIWFGVLYAITIQTGYISPPFGYTLFYIKGPLPAHLGMETVYKGVLPFMLLQMCALIFCAVFPDLVTWLPSLMDKR